MNHPNNNSWKFGPRLGSASFTHILYSHLLVIFLFLAAKSYRARLDLQDIKVRYLNKVPLHT